MTSYEDAKAYVLGIPKFAGKNTLEDTKALLDRVYTEGSAKIIHIAGTNGKGSAAAYLSSVLRCAGLRTALFTSPHLVSVRERIVCGGEMISREKFSEHFDRISQDRS